MPSVPSPDRVAVVPEAELYIGELQEFFTSRQVTWGRAQDLALLSRRLESDPPFAEETGSMLRSILYRESERLGAQSLCELLSSAATGSSPGKLEPSYAAHQQELLAVVTGLLRSHNGRPLPDIADEDVSVSPQPHVSSEELPPLAASGLNQPQAPVSPREALAAVPRSSDSDAGINQRLSKLLFSPVEEEAKEPLEKLASDSGEQSTLSEAEPTTSSVGDQVLPEVEPRRKSLGALLQRSYWIPGLCLLLLATLVAFWMRQRDLPAAPITSSIATRDASQSAAVTPPRRELNPEAPTATAPTTGATHSSKGPGLGTSLSGARATPRHASSHPVTRNNNGVFLTSSGVMAGHLVFAPAPGYPRLASFTRTEGQVTLQITITRSGTVGSTRVLDGPHLLRGAAEHAVRRWRYRPFFVNGQPTDVSSLVTVTFRLR